jgi:hypothetical protein
MTAEPVDAAVEVIVRRDPTLGEWAQAAADDLTAGEGEEVLGQAFVQDFLWYRLPAEYPERAWFPLARAVAALMGELGLERYASIAKSDMTTTILEVWHEDRARGFARYRTAAEASGAKPPDIELLAWGGGDGLRRSLRLRPAGDGARGGARGGSVRAGDIGVEVTGRVADRRGPARAPTTRRPPKPARDDSLGTSPDMGRDRAGHVHAW